VPKGRDTGLKTGRFGFFTVFSALRQGGLVLLVIGGEEKPETRRIWKFKREIREYSEKNEKRE